MPALFKSPASLGYCPECGRRANAHGCTDCRELREEMNPTSAFNPWIDAADADLEDEDGDSME